MTQLIKRISQPPTYPGYEHTQRAGVLYYSLVVVGIGSVLIGLINLPQGAVYFALFLFMLAAFCVFGVIANSYGHYRPVAAIFSILVLIAMNFNLVDGAALHDPGVAAYPIFLLFTGFLFGKKSLPFSTVLVISSFIAVYMLGLGDIVMIEPMPTLNRLAILSVLMVVAAVILWAITRSWENTLERVRTAYDLTLEGWAKALEYRDQETEAHSQQVVALTMELAAKLGLNERQMADVRRGSILHDIGKIAIPDSILLKPGPLDDEEWATMKAHPHLAREMLAKIPFLQDAITIPYFHHERWDGSGYPEGLAGTEIPLAARIFAVVDTWEALNSDRPYRKAWERDTILIYIKENAGILYDPKVVAAFLETI